VRRPSGKRTKRGAYRNEAKRRSQTAQNCSSRIPEKTAGGRIEERRGDEKTTTGSSYHSAAGGRSSRVANE